MRRVAEHQTPPLLSCRLCLSDEQDVDLFGDYLRGVQYSIVVASLFDFQVSQHVSLPDKICSECAASVVQFHKFRTKCMEVNERLKNIIIESTTTDIDCDEMNPPNDDDSQHHQPAAVSAVADVSELPAVALDEIIPISHLLGGDTSLIELYVVESPLDDFPDAAVSAAGDDDDDDDDDDDVNIDDDHIEYSLVVENNPDDEGTVIEEYLLEEDTTVCGTPPSSDERADVDVDDADIDSADFVHLMDEDDYEELESLHPPPTTSTTSSSSPQAIARKSTQPRPADRSKTTTAKAAADARGRYACDQCGRVFCRKFTRDQHRLTHTGAKDHECHLCGARFTRSSHIEAHLRIHMNVRPYACALCGRSFTKSGDLLRHRRVHTDVRDFRCAECPKCFKRPSDLQVHMLSHTGHRPYVCAWPACDKSYTSHSSLKKHRLKYHPPADGGGGAPHE